MIAALLDPRVLLAALILAIASAGGGYVKGYRDADKTALIEELRKDVKDADERASLADAAKAEAVRQAEAARSIATRAAERERTASADAATRQGMLDDYVRALAEAEERAASAGRCSCSLSDDDVRRLRGIAGTPGGTGPSGPPRRAD